MDTNHAIGCSLIGLGLTAFLIRLMWMSSPPFNAMPKGRLAAWRNGLVLTTATMLSLGAFLLSRPVSPEAQQQMAEEGFRFH